MSAKVFVSDSLPRDAPYFDKGPGTWFQKWGDPLGQNTEFSGVDPIRPPFPNEGNWQRYRFQAGNVLFLMLADRNDVPTPVGRGSSAEGSRGGYPAGAVTSAADTDLFARLIDVAPGGMARDVSLGMVRARFRNSMEKPELIKPGEVVRYTIEMNPTSNAFLPRHRIRLDITSSDFPNYDRNHNTPADQKFRPQARDRAADGASRRNPCNANLPALGSRPGWWVDFAATW